MNIISILAAMFVSFIVGIVATLNTYEEKLNIYHKAIKECELNLPRTHNCVITAVPEEK